jgi:hypothetical protein
VLWAAFVTRPYLSLDPDVVPVGGEYLSAIQTHHLWNWMRACGLCALWNGSERGGAPAFADPYGSALHPLVMLSTLGWGVRNGAKIALVLTFALGGCAQWWLARVLGLGRLARLWSGALAVVAGHLAGRIENGNIGIVLSTVACALALPPLLTLARTGGRRSAMALAAMLALAIVSGQGYMQIGLACVLPLALLLPRDGAARLLLLRRLALACGVALLLAGVFLVPLAHFLPEFRKYIDPQFRSATPPLMMPLFLLVDDPAFFYTTYGPKLPYPFLYVNFIGVGPLLLAAWGALRHTPAERRVVCWLVASAALLLWLASGSPLAWGARNIRVPIVMDALAGIRCHPVMAGLAVPPLLALAALGVERLAARLRTGAARRGGGWWPLVAHVALALALAAALAQAYRFATRWIATRPLPAEVAPILAALRTPSLQWVNPPFGDHTFIEPAVGVGYKLSSGFRTWEWKDRPEPLAMRQADRPRWHVREGMRHEASVGTTRINVGGLESEYALLVTPGAKTIVCRAQGLAGDIDVVCDTPQGGVLTVKENRWQGWHAFVDGAPARLWGGQWLAVSVPKGRHTVQLRYRPWDVPLGLGLTVAGALLALFLAWRPDAPAARTPAA